MSSDQPTGQPPYPVPPLSWSAPLAPPLQTPVSLPEPGPPINEINPVLAKYDVPEVVPDVNPGPDWGGIANGLNPVDFPKPYAFTQWTLLSRSQHSNTDLLTEGTYVEGMGTLVRTVVTLRDQIAVSTSFLAGVKIADGQLVPFSHHC